MKDGLLRSNAQCELRRCALIGPIAPQTRAARRKAECRPQEKVMIPMAGAVLTPGAVNQLRIHSHYQTTDTRLDRFRAAILPRESRIPFCGAPRSSYSLAARAAAGDLPA
jgi:hypothetical protein